MSHQEAVNFHKKTGKKIMCLSQYLPQLNIWVSTNNNGIPNLLDITSDEQIEINKLKLNPNKLKQYNFNESINLIIGNLLD